MPESSFSSNLADRPGHRDSRSQTNGAEADVLVCKARRAAAYVRMSKEQQKYSTTNQLDRIREYAKIRNFDIVKIFSDGGKSGLSMEGREALARLLKEVQATPTPFEVILVYDVSRWGRFQDADESAYYEYLCRRRGITIHYCAELFENDGGPMSTILKSMKRVMAAEYSRELSAKVFYASCRMIERGFRQGGSAGFGLRRMLLDQDGTPKCLLKLGEQKSLSTDRVILVPGPPQEVEIVRWIYQAFTEEGKGETEIARSLNERGILTASGRKWYVGQVQNLLTNEKYIGSNIYCRTSAKLRTKRVVLPSEEWLRVPGAFTGIVSSEQFLKARERIQRRRTPTSDEELLAQLRRFVEKKGKLASRMLDGAKDVPSRGRVMQRFGGFKNVYRLIGYDTKRNLDFVELSRKLRECKRGLIESILKGIRSVGGTACWDASERCVKVNDEIRLVVVVACFVRPVGKVPRWQISELGLSASADLALLARMNDGNCEMKDFYLMPPSYFKRVGTFLYENNGFEFDSFRFSALSEFFELTRRSPLPS